MSKPRPGLPANPPAPADAAFTEAPTWSAIGTGWRPLFGNFRALGFSFERHDFKTEEEQDWSRRFHPGSLELFLNFDGPATLSAHC